MPFDFTNTTPAASEAPAQSQPKMLQNFQSTETILAVDHVTFNNATGGQHKQVTYVDILTPAAPTGDTSIGYADEGVADPGTPEHYWKNRNATFPLSAIKAFGVFVGQLRVPNPMVPILNGYNILSIAYAFPSEIYTITLKSGVTSTDNVAIFIMDSKGNTYGYTSFSSSSGVLTLAPLLTGNTISFLILQI
jgi:hypothetical protein